MTNALKAEIEAEAKKSETALTLVIRSHFETWMQHTGTGFNLERTADDKMYQDLRTEDYWQGYYGAAVRLEMEVNTLRTSNATWDSRWKQLINRFTEVLKQVTTTEIKPRGVFIETKQQSGYSFINGAGDVANMKAIKETNEKNSYCESAQYAYNHRDIEHAVQMGYTAALYTDKEFMADAKRFEWLAKSVWYVGPQYSADEAGGTIDYDDHNLSLEYLRASIDKRMEEDKIK